MVVKNIPDYHLPSQTHLSPNLKSKPYFLESLEYSKNILLKLKKQKLQKQNDLQLLFYPHILLLLQLYSQNLTKNFSKILKTNTQNKKFNDIQSSSKQLIIQKNIIIIRRFKQYQQLYFKFTNQEDQEFLEWLQKYNRVIYQISSIIVKQLISALTIITKKNLSLPYNQQKRYEQQLKQVGQSLQNIQDQLEYYQIIFDNLCDFYRNNQAIVIKNNQLKKQALRLSQQKNAIINQLNVVYQEFHHFYIQEKQSNKIIGQYVKEYVKNVCYNSFEGPILVTKQGQIQKQNKIIQINDQEKRYIKINQILFIKIQNKNIKKKLKRKSLLRIRIFKKKLLSITKTPQFLNIIKLNSQIFYFYSFSHLQQNIFNIFEIIIVLIYFLSFWLLFLDLLQHLFVIWVLFVLFVIWVIWVLFVVYVILVLFFMQYLQLHLQLLIIFSPLVVFGVCLFCLHLFFLELLYLFQLQQLQHQDFGRACWQRHHHIWLQAYFEFKHQLLLYQVQLQILLEPNPIFFPFLLIEPQEKYLQLDLFEFSQQDVQQSLQSYFSIFWLELQQLQKVFFCQCGNLKQAFDNVFQEEPLQLSLLFLFQLYPYLNFL